MVSWTASNWKTIKLLSCLYAASKHNPPAFKRLWRYPSNDLYRPVVQTKQYYLEPAQVSAYNYNINNCCFDHPRMWFRDTGRFDQSVSFVRPRKFFEGMK